MPEFVRFPAAGTSWSEWLTMRVGAGIATTRDLLAQLKDGTARTTDEVLELWNDADLALGSAAATAHLFAEVHPDEAVRTLAEEQAQELSRIETDRGLDRDLYEVLAGTGDTGDEQQRRFRAHALRDFRRSGVDRSEDVARPAARDRRAAHRARPGLRPQHPRRRPLDPGRARAARRAARGLSSTPTRSARTASSTITTDYPDCDPVPHLRRDAAGAPRPHASSSSTAAGRPTTRCCARCSTCAHEQASLLGYARLARLRRRGQDDRHGAADRRVHRQDHRSLPTPPASATTTACSTARRRTDPMRRRRSTRRPHLLRGADPARASTRSTPRWCAATSTSRACATACSTSPARLFGIEYRERADAPLWHADVTAYDVVARRRRVLGRIYLDLHPREGKFKHAAQFDLAPGVTGRQLPEGVLVATSRAASWSTRRRHAASTSSATSCTTCSAGASAGRGSPASPPSGTSSRRRRRCSRNGRGTPTCCAPSPPTPTATPIPRELVDRMRAARRVRQGLLRPHADVLRGARPTCCTATGPPT